MYFLQQLINYNSHSFLKGTTQYLLKKYRGGWQRTTIPPISIVPFGASPKLYFPLNKAFPFKTSKANQVLVPVRVSLAERSSIRVAHHKSARPLELRIPTTQPNHQKSEREVHPTLGNPRVKWQVVQGRGCVLHRQLLREAVSCTVTSERLYLVNVRLKLPSLKLLLQYFKERFLFVSFSKVRIIFESTKFFLTFFYFFLRFVIYTYQPLKSWIPT